MSAIVGKKLLKREELTFQEREKIEEYSKGGGLKTINVSLEEDGGNPGVEKTYENGNLDIVLKNLKGADGADGNDGATGPQGPQGRPGTDYQPIEDISGLLIAHSLGRDEAKVMSQKGVTDIVLPIQDGNMYYPGIVSGYIKSTGEVVTGTGSKFQVTDYILLEEGQEKVNIVSGVWKPGAYYQIFFYSAANEQSAISGINTGTNSTEITNTSYDVPEGAKYYRLTVAPNVDAVISFTGSLKQIINGATSDIATIKTDVSNLKDTKEQQSYDLEVTKSLLNVNTYAVKSIVAGVLNSSGNVASGSSAVRAFGVSDYIPVTPSDNVKLVSGFKQPGGTGYQLVAFYRYNDNDTGSLVSTVKDTSFDETQPYNITVPAEAAYMRVVLANNSVYGKILINTPSNIPSLKTDVDALKESKFEKQAQIKNNPLPIKTQDEVLNILFIGSSYGVDTIDALVDICKSVNLKVNTYDSYKSGGTMAQYMNCINNDIVDDYVVYKRIWNAETPLTWDSNLKMKNLITAKSWDVIIFDDNYARQPSFSPERHEAFTELLAWAKEKCTNPRVVFALNSSWTFKANMNKQDESFKVIQKDMKYTGIDVIIPSGAAICNLRDTNVNDGNDIYRDNKHLDPGVGRFTAACALYYAIVYYVYGVDLTNCDVTGAWTQAGSPGDTAIEVTDANRATCIECAKKANANRFLL